VSRRCVGYEGEGRARRPMYVDEGPAAAGATDGLAAVGRLSALQIRTTAGSDVDLTEQRAALDRAIERVHADQADRAAHFGREAFRAPAALTDAQREQQSRMRGGQRTSQIHASRRTAAQPVTSPEEPTVSERPAEHSDPIPGVDVGLDRLAVASETARQAWDARAAACTAWDIAREALAEAWRAISGEVLETPGPFIVVHRPQATAIGVSGAEYGHHHDPDAATEPPAAAVSGRRHQSKANEAREKADRARRVMEAMARHGDDQRAVAAELGMRANAVAMVVKHARARDAQTVSA
jgi:hypothetical protein